MMQSPEARQYDTVQTPDSGGKGKRNFGVRRRKFDGSEGHDRRDPIVENARDGRSGGGETAAFQRVRRLSAIGRQVNVEDFRFGPETSSLERSGRNGPSAISNSNSNGGSGSGKYMDRSRSAAISIRPGASIMGQPPTTPSNEEEERLWQLGSPPREMDSFVKGIVNTTRKAPMTSAAGVGANATRLQPPRLSGRRLMGSLESASTPTTVSTTVKTPLTAIPSRSGWQAPTRMQRDAVPPPGAKRARVELTPTIARRASIETTATNGGGGATRVSSRIQQRPPRDTFGMYDDANATPPTATASVARRYAKMPSTGSFRSSTSNSDVTPLLRRSTRASPKPKDGTEDMPIHLSDSEEDEEGEENPSSVHEEDLKFKAGEQSEAVDDVNFDMSAVRKETLFDYQATRAWFGERACHIDVYIGREVMWLCSVRGVEQKWPFASNYRIALKRVKRVRVYRWTEDQVGTVDTSDPAGKVMSTISFIAFQFPIPDVLLKTEWREFYDPDADESSSKRYLILLAKDEDRDGLILSTMEDMLPQRRSVEYLNTLEDVRPLAKPMIEHDDHYVFRDRPRADEPRRSRRRRGADDDGMDGTQLTYPLPPCTVDLVTITRQDIARLQPAEYLNDNIIDYYLKRLLIEDYASDELVKQNVLFLNSHFYSRLRAGKGVNMKERLAAGYKNVSTWLTRSDLFSRTLVFVPINKDLHWSLAVIINPKCAGGDDDEENAPQTCIALLDPLGGYHSSIPILRNLKSFLAFEWARVSGVNSYEPGRVAKVQVTAPLQTNSFDCGVFVLKYAQEMLVNFASLLADTARDTKPTRDGFLLPRAMTNDGLTDLLPHDAFTARDVTIKRKELQILLAEDTKSYEAILDTKAEAKYTKAEP